MVTSNLALTKDEVMLLASLLLKISFARYLVGNVISDFFLPFLSLWVAYFALGATMIIFLHYNRRYLLIHSNWTIRHLISQIDSSARDLFVLLPVSVVVVKHFNMFPLILTKAEDIAAFYWSPWAWACIPIGIYLGLVCRMAAHYILHHPLLYKRIHKMHHIIPENMTPFSTFNDHPIEFFCMEIIGTFLLPCVLRPLPAPVLAAVWAMQVCLGVLDHSNAVVPGSFFIDAEYHLTHHQVVISAAPVWCVCMYVCMYVCLCYSFSVIFALTLTHHHTFFSACVFS